MPTSKTERAREDGFTLLELLVVLAVIAAVAAIAVPNVTTPGSATDAGRAVRSLADALADARQRAIFENRDAGVEINVEELRIRRADGDIETMPETIRIRLKSAENEDRSRATGGIRFFPDGSSTGGAIEIDGADGGRMGVRVHWLTGRIEIDG